MHILLIHQAFASVHEAGGTRHYELAKHMARKGHSFTVIASNLSYLTGRPVNRGEAGSQTDRRNGTLRVVRAPALGGLHRGFAWRTISFISFMTTSLLAAIRAGPADLVMGTTPPIFQAASAWLVALLRRRPFLLEVRDLWPEFAIDMGVLKNPALIALSRWLERFLYSRADMVLVNSPAYREYLAARNVAAAKIRLIPNGADPEMFLPDTDGPKPKKPPGLEGKFVIAYAGALGTANDIPTLLRAAELLKNEPEIHFLLVGDGAERESLERMAGQRGLSNVSFAGAFPKSRIPETLAASDACLAILKNIPMFRTTYPNKVFDYMGAARPIILAIDGVIRKVVEEAGAGIFVPPGDASALAAAAKRLHGDPQAAREMGRAGRAHVIEHFSRSGQAEEFERLALSMIG